MQRIEIRLKESLPDPRGLALVRDIHDLGISGVSDARVFDIYWLDGELNTVALETISRGLLADTVTQEYAYRAAGAPDANTPPGYHSLEVAYHPGVTDPIEATILKAIHDLKVTSVRAVKTARRYLLKGNLSPKELETIAGKLLVNPIIQHVVREEPTTFPEPPQYDFAIKELDLTEVGQQFGFSETELNAITDYFRRQGRKPTDVEIETLFQTWSEHCVHKTFKARIQLDDRVVDNLMKTTIMKSTRELNKPWCLSVFADNAGVIDFDGEQALCFKVETHNHPSAIEPYGGAATGIGGVVRDPLGTGLGAKPIMNTDVFCFAPPNFPQEQLPPGVLHPRRIFKGVRAGVADYGNRLGIPTLNGAVLFDERYLANPLVFCGTLGLMPVEMAPLGKQNPGDKVLLIGGKTGRDGIHGVTFASEQLTDESHAESISAVQIGNPIVEKKVIDTLLQARDRRLYNRVTDCGGGGLSSAVGEMGEITGVRVDLEKVPLKYAGLSYTEIWVSESQERMILAVPPDKETEILKLFADEDVEAVIIGEFTNDKKLSLYYQNKLVGQLEMEFLHEGIPQIERQATVVAPREPEPDFACPADLGPVLLEILSQWNVCSKEWVIRQYDHEVQGGSVLKPLVGRASDGPGDAAVIRPVLTSDRGAVVSCGINPCYGEIDSYWMAASAIDEALRQIIAVGGSLERVALLDNFCWGDVRDPEILGALVGAAEACHDMAKAYGTPFISGKDSLYNEFEYKGKSTSIPHTLLVSAVGVITDVNRCVTMDLKRAGNLIYIIGETRNELGGSAYYQTHDSTGNTVPQVDPTSSKNLMDKLSRATAAGLVAACHDLSEGGLGVAIAEMAFAGGLGAIVKLAEVPRNAATQRDDQILFSESNSRFLAEITPEHEAEFLKIMKGTKLAAIGQVTDESHLQIYGLAGKPVVTKTLAELKEAWQQPLRW